MNVLPLNVCCMRKVPKLVLENPYFDKITVSIHVWTENNKMGLQPGQDLSHLVYTVSKPIEIRNC